MPVAGITGKECGQALAAREEPSRLRVLPKLGAFLRFIGEIAKRLDGRRLEHDVFPAKAAGKKLAKFAEVVASGFPGQFRRFRRRGRVPASDCDDLPGVKAVTACEPPLLRDIPAGKGRAVFLPQSRLVGERQARLLDEMIHEAVPARDRLVTFAHEDLHRRRLDRAGHGRSRRVPRQIKASPAQRAKRWMRKKVSGQSRSSMRSVSACAADQPRRWRAHAASVARPLCFGPVMTTRRGTRRVSESSMIEARDSCGQLLNGTRAGALRRMPPSEASGAASPASQRGIIGSLTSGSASPVEDSPA